jgi:hypothetical protein
MSAIYPLSIHHRIERQWAERIKSLRQNRSQTAFGTERALQRLFNSESPLIPIPRRSIVRRRLDRSQPRD